ncbi:MAG: SLC13 family permease [Neomegalonema sp.]|nr:SLC13 family permease [Neomegalonema sp.]
MSNAQILVLALLAATLGLFALTRLRHDIVALLALVAVAITGLLDPEKIFSGFGHPAVITVMGVLIISHALNRAGVVGMIADALAPYTVNQTLHLLSLTGVVAVMSAFMNNVGALALMMPVAMATAAKHGRSPSILLMPLSFASLLGGMTTLIGTPPNIIVASFRGAEYGGSFAMFDFAAVGVPVTIMGVLFVSLIGWRLLPKERQSADTQRALFTVGGYLAELRILEGSDFIGRTLSETSADFEGETKIFGIERGNQLLPAVGYRVFAAGDVMILRATPEVLAKLVEEHKLEIVTEKRDKALALDREIDWKDASLLEVIIAPNSPLVGRNARVVDRVFGQDVGLIAMSRHGAPLRGRLREQTFHPGDIALLQGKHETLGELVERFQMLPLAERGLSIGKRREPWMALGIFAIAIIAAALGVLPIAVCFIVAVLAYVVLGVLPLRELYAGVDWSVIVLLGAMFPLGMALDETGATGVLAQYLVGFAEHIGLEPWGVLVVLMIATMAITDVINNAATALIMAPIALQIATTLDVNPDAFLMAVAVGASSAFLTPIGHQCNTLVMGPGGYKFTDYWRLGLPLEILLVSLAVPLLLTFWPL